MVVQRPDVRAGLCAAVTAVCVHSPVAQAQLALHEIQRNLTAQCVVTGLAGNGDPATIAAVCTCVCTALTSSLTIREIAEVDKAAREKGRPEELPQVQRLMPKLRDCERQHGSGMPK